MEWVGATIGSEELGLAKGNLAELDVVVSKLPREQLARRIVTILTGLIVDRPKAGRTLSISLARTLGTHGKALATALADPNAVFLEPMQQLVVLRRCLTVSTEGEHDVWGEEGLRAYLDACRISADISRTELEFVGKVPDTPEVWLRIAADFLLRLSLLNPPHPTNWFARLRLMFRELPKEHDSAKQWVTRLEERLVATFRMNLSEVGTFVQMLMLWSLRFEYLDILLQNPGAVAIDIDKWIQPTHLKLEQLQTFFQRTARSTSETLSDQGLGGPLSILPFRDRPFLRFEDGTVAPVYPALVAEKLTYDLFWWTGSVDKKQSRPWQRDWGDLVEAYVVGILEWIAAETGCGFRGDLKWVDGQVDAAMWFKGHVALFEITAGMLTDVAAHSGDSNELGNGLRRTFVRSERDEKAKDEAIAQLARDIRAFKTGRLAEHISVKDAIQVYPVMIAVDRRVRTPPLRLWFENQFNAELEDADRAGVGPVTVLALEDLESVEQLTRDQHPALRGTPRGMLRLLRDWQLKRDRLPKTGKRALAWHHFINSELGMPGTNTRLKTESDQWMAEVEKLFKDPEG